MLGNSTNGWLSFTSKHLNNGRLTSTIWTNYTSTGRQSQSQVHIGYSWLIGTRVLEGTVFHLQNTLTLRLDVIKVTRFREVEFNSSSLQFVVRLGFWYLFNELRKITDVALQLTVLVVHNVGTYIVQETGVVRNNQRSYVRHLIQVVLQPSNVRNIQVIRRFIQQQNISVHQHSTSQFKLHLPTTRQTANSLSAQFIIETNAGKHFNNLLTGYFTKSHKLFIVHDEVNNVKVSFFSLQV